MKRLVVMLAFVSCTRSYATRATYDAPKSGFRMIVDATGIVPRGEDLGAGATTVLVCPRATPSARQLSIELAPYSTAPRRVVAHDGPTATTLAWDFKTANGSLTRALIGVGFAPDAVEVEEAVRAIDGVGEGPKGTPIAGQTHALTVVKIDFEKTGAPHCPP